MNVAVSNLYPLFLSGSWAELLDRSAPANAPETRILRARVLIAKGQAVPATVKTADGNRRDETAEELLRPIAESAGDLSLEAQAELLYARYVGVLLGATDKDLTVDLAASIAAAATPKSKTQIRARVTAGLIALRKRDFERARLEMERAGAAADEAGDEAEMADVDFALGRLAAWHGRADAARKHLGAAIGFWKAQGNDLLSAHPAYELAVMHIDRRECATASAILCDVVKSYETAGVVQGYLDRARQKLASALTGAGELDAAEAILQTLRNASDPYRFAMVHRDLTDIWLSRAAEASGDSRRTALDAARTFWSAAFDKVQTAGPDDFAVLNLRQREAQLMMEEPDGRTVDTLTLAGDMFARVAEAFSANTSERPHEVNARIGAMEAYLAGAETPDVSDLQRASLYAAAHTEAERLTSAAASIDFQLEDDVLELIARAGRAQGIEQAAANDEEPLLAYMRRNLSHAERLETLARLAEALGRLHQMGASPTGFGPSDVVVRHPGSPAVRSFDGPDALRRPERAADRPFASPESLRQAECDASSDLYVLGSLLIAWFGERLPANEGRPMLWVRRAFRGEPLKQWGNAVSGLALELTSLSRKNRSLTAYECADRFRQAKLQLPDTLNAGGPTGTKL